MPTKTKKKATAPKKKTAAPKAVKPKKKAAAPAPVEKKTGFMWKLLERKEAALKERENKAAGVGHIERFQAHGADVYARFNGPRRKAA